MKRYFVETNGYNMVVFVDDNNDVFYLHEKAFDEDLTLEVARNADYSNVEGFETAKQMAANYYTGENYIKNGWDELINNCEDYIEF